MSTSGMLTRWSPSSDSVATDASLVSSRCPVTTTLRQTSSSCPYTTNVTELPPASRLSLSEPTASRK
jgi:hypothetical protein